MQDLILSVVKDRSWADLDCYALSLSRSGYSGRRVMLVEGVPEDAQARLRELGFSVLPTQVPGGAHFQTTRYVPARNYLREHHGEFRNVLWTDVCDQVFQTDPSEAMARALRGKELIAVKEGWAIKDQDINDIWIQKLGLPRHDYEFLREQEVLCSGTIAGTELGMRTLFESMCGAIGGLDAMQGMDQGLFNWLVRTPPFGFSARIPEPEEGFCSTLGIFLAPSDPTKWTIPPPVLDWDTGRVLTPDGKTAYAMAHQYNRRYGKLDPAGSWRETLERSYRA